MSWYNGKHCKDTSNLESAIDILNKQKGKLSIEEAQIWFTKFCKYNPSFTVKLLLGVTLAPIQDIIIRSFFIRDYGLMIAGRGFSKSFTISIFIILYALFTPGTKIVICSGTFRQSKLIFKQIEKNL